MIFKEFRIPLPLTVEEYRIGQAYYLNKLMCTHLKKNLGAINLFEKDTPYTNSDGTNGLYSKKRYLLNDILPYIVRIAIPSKIFLEEEIWNEYPYTRTKISSPSLVNFSLETFNYYLPDCGDTEGSFNHIEGIPDQVRSVV
ncbi:hypothetical protein HZS_1407 [Henneguya salminicola]|nr:hypothetical protein HZS_1407 [Henneguya salminicola]